MLLSKPLIHLILTKDIPFDYNVAARFTFWLLFTQPFVAIIRIDHSYFNATGHFNYSLISTLIGLWVIRIPVLYSLALIFNNVVWNASWISLVVSNVVMVVINLFLKKRITLERKVSYYA